MALEDIIKKIEADAEGEVNRIKAAAEATGEEILDQAKKEAEDKRRALLKKGEDDAERVRKRILQIADLDARKIILTAKRQVISDVFDRASKKLLEAENYRDMFYKMLLSGVETGEEEVVISAYDRKRIDQGLINSVNAELKKKGKKGKLVLAKDDAHTTGGFILRRGKVEMDSSFSSLIKSQRDNLEIHVAEIMFS